MNVNLPIERKMFDVTETLVGAPLLVKVAMPVGTAFVDQLLLLVHSESGPCQVASCAPAGPAAMHMPAQEGRCRRTMPCAAIVRGRAFYCYAKAPRPTPPTRKPRHGRRGRYTPWAGGRTSNVIEFSFAWQRKRG